MQDSKDESLDIVAADYPIWKMAGCYSDICIKYIVMISCKKLVIKAHPLKVSSNYTGKKERNHIKTTQNPAPNTIYIRLRHNRLSHQWDTVDIL